MVLGMGFEGEERKQNKAVCPNKMCNIIIGIL